MHTALPILVPMISIASLLLGAWLNEFVRRRNRRELFAPRIFEKRLDAYEGLLAKVHSGSKIADEVIENKDLTQEDRHALISTVIHEIIAFCEGHSLYIDEELSVH